MTRPNLPDAARLILKSVVVSLGTTGLASPADVALILALLDLHES